MSPFNRYFVVTFIAILGFSSAIFATYTLKPGDTVDIKVVWHEELTSKQVITPDGTISIPLLGRVDVENKLETENGGD